MRRLVAIFAVWLLLIGTAFAHSGDVSQREYPNKVEGKHITVYYQTQGPFAVKREFAQRVLDLAETSYERFVSEGGLRPPRVDMVPLYLTDVGGGALGTASPAALGFGTFMTVSPFIQDPGRLADVISHELFHVLQTAYQKGGSTPGWAIEGTASVAPMYAFKADEAGAHKSALTSHLSMYWISHSASLLERVYDASLFWYVTAEKYGGLDYLHRLLTWSEDVEWMRAAQLAAIENGAPADTTFDTLYRSFVFDLLRGQVPADYKADKWFQPQRVRWTGQGVSLTRGDLEFGLTKMGQGYAYYQPLIVQPYSFHLIEVQHQTGAAAELTISGDDGLEVYLLRPGTKVVEALRDQSKRPNSQEMQSPPADPGMAAVHLSMGHSVRLEGKTDDRSLVVVLRTGHWGPGTYRVDLKPVGTGALATPNWKPLAELPHAAHSPGSPPPLSEAERKALAAGSWLTGSLPLEFDETLAALTFRRLEATFGSTSVWLNDAEVTLPFPVERTSTGQILFPAKAVTELMGFKVEGNRLIWGDNWWQVTPGSASVQTQRGTMGLPHTPVERNGDLVMEMGFLLNSGAGCDVTTRGDTVTVICPGPNAIQREAAGH